MSRINLGSYGLILADPPWAFKTWSGKKATPHRTANDHYVTQESDWLERLPVRMLAAKDAALALWIVDSHLKQAIGVAAAWGFSFKTVLFVWEKCAPGAVPKISMGYYTRKQCELCLGFTRGSPKVRSHAVRQLIQEPRREHSRKPDEQYPRLEALFDGPRIELFARSRRPGWHVWGDQVTKFQPEEKKHG